MRQQELEGQLRVSHSRITQNAENINFYGGEATELALLEDTAAPVAENLRSYSNAKLPMDCVSLVLFFAQFGMSHSFAVTESARAHSYFLS